MSLKNSTLPSQLTSPFTIIVYFIVPSIVIVLPVFNLLSVVKLLYSGIFPLSVFWFIFSVNFCVVYSGDTFTYFSELLLSLQIQYLCLY